MEQVGKEWIQIALDITSGISSAERFNKLLLTVHQTLKCDASALLLFKEQQFIPLAINGLSQDVLDKHFEISKHQRLEVIAKASDIVRFPSDSDLPNLYNDLISNHDKKLKVYSCIGIPLFQEDKLIGALTIDADDSKAFNYLTNNTLRMIGTLASNCLNTAILQEKLNKSTEFTNYKAGVEKITKNIDEIIGNSASILLLKQHINIVSNTDLSVLIMGETGVGKELVAKAIHANSDRADKPMIYLNCAALPESVAESELFGHVKGAFTGAFSNRKGKFQVADRGTLFLDEIGELSLPLQAKLLRTLQYGDIQRVGDDTVINVDVRIIAATNRVMHEEVVAGHFRVDLYHRLSVFPITVPPLRERDNDIMLLMVFFAEKCAAKLGIQNIRFDHSIDLLSQEYSWRGNVRELEHAINRAAILARSESLKEHLLLLPRHFNFSVYPIISSNEQIKREDEIRPVNFNNYAQLSLKEAIDQFQSELVSQVYNANNKNLSQTARQLKLNPGNLCRLMKRLNTKSLS